MQGQPFLEQRGGGASLRHLRSGLSGQPVGGGVSQRTPWRTLPLQCAWSSPRVSLLLCVSGSPLFKCSAAGPDFEKQSPGGPSALELTRLRARTHVGTHARTHAPNLLAFPYLRKASHLACPGHHPLCTPSWPYLLSGGSPSSPHPLSGLSL